MRIWPKILAEIAARDGLRLPETWFTGFGEVSTRLLAIIIKLFIRFDLPNFCWQKFDFRHKIHH